MERDYSSGRRASRPSAPRQSPRAHRPEYCAASGDRAGHARAMNIWYGETPRGVNYADAEQGDSDGKQYLANVGSCSRTLSRSTNVISSLRVCGARRLVRGGGAGAGPHYRVRAFKNPSAPTN
ncbi:hypothetical protein EVAR_59497_1 [Eumeta japonica]|uniref:Uncharacterized protein n=1 Tax=Eumeta variegata TaxID=151549 RepID=A0A4C1YIC4_EUMVA|nr:hypothetical protein EVAR_59497_1 [Eumeta japonica]